jgi:hypothetical protein
MHDLKEYDMNEKAWQIVHAVFYLVADYVVGLLDSFHDLGGSVCLMRS